MFIQFEEAQGGLMFVNADHVLTAHLDYDTNYKEMVVLVVTFGGDKPNRSDLYFGPADMTAEEVTARCDVLQTVLNGTAGDHDHGWSKAADAEQRKIGALLPR